MIGVRGAVLFATPACGALRNGSPVRLKIDQSLHHTRAVRGDGTIAIPEVAAVPIEGVTLEGAEDCLFQRMVQNQLDPEFSLVIAEFNSKLFSIGGVVESSAVVPISLNPPLLEKAITTDGGITFDSLGFGSIRIYRNGGLNQIPPERI